jgi:hypothetical protein
VDVGSITVTAAVTLLGVALGGWLTVWNQDRMWRREHSRQWRGMSAYLPTGTFFPHIGHIWRSSKILILRSQRFCIRVALVVSNRGTRGRLRCAPLWA